MRATLLSIIVGDQAHALSFYRDALGLAPVPKTATFDDSCGNFTIPYETPEEARHG